MPGSRILHAAEDHAAARDDANVTADGRVFVLAADDEALVRRHRHTIDNVVATEHTAHNAAKECLRSLFFRRGIFNRECIALIANLEILDNAAVAIGN